LLPLAIAAWALVIGLGIDPANATRIRQWVNDWDLPVAVTPKVKGIVDETAPTDLPRWTVSELPRARRILAEMGERPPGQSP